MEDLSLRPAIAFPVEMKTAPGHEFSRQGTNRLLFNTSLSRKRHSSFVISGGAQRSGEISVWMHFPGSVFDEAWGVIQSVPRSSLPLLFLVFLCLTLG
jgi:hypothetical protein